MPTGIPIQLPRSYEEPTGVPAESPFVVATRGAVLRALRGVPAPDFSANISPDVDNPHYDFKNPEAQALARALWRDFLKYMELRQAEGQTTFDLNAKGRGPYPFQLPPGQGADPHIGRKRRNAFLFGLADSLISKSTGAIDQEQVRTLAAVPPDSAAATETAAAFLLAFAYSGSQAQSIINEHRTRFPAKPKRPPKTPPPRQQRREAA